MIPLVCASVAFTTAFSALILAIRHSRRMRRDLEELVLRRQAEDRSYQDAREHLTILNNQLAFHTRIGRSDMEVTEEDFVHAQVKSRNHLLVAMTDEQRAEFERTGDFHVTARGSGRRYRLAGGSWVGNIYQEGNDWETDPFIFEKYHGQIQRQPRWCMHLYNGYRYNYPVYDHLLAQALMIRNDEETFRKIANPM